MMDCPPPISPTTAFGRFYRDRGKKKDGIVVVSGPGMNLSRETEYEGTPKQFILEEVEKDWKMLFTISFQRIRMLDSCPTWVEEKRQRDPFSESRLQEETDPLFRLITF